MISSLDTETADKVKRINLLFDMMKDAQKCRENHGINTNTICSEKVPSILLRYGQSQILQGKVNSEPLPLQ